MEGEQHMMKFPLMDVDESISPSAGVRYDLPEGSYAMVRALIRDPDEGLLGVPMIVLVLEVIARGLYLGQVHAAGFSDTLNTIGPGIIITFEAGHVGEVRLGEEARLLECALRQEHELRREGVA